MTSVGLISCVISHPSVELGFVAAETSSGKILFQMPHFKRNQEEARQRRQAQTVFVEGPGKAEGTSRGLLGPSGSYNAREGEV